MKLEEVQVLQVEAEIERTKALTKEVEANTELKRLSAEMMKVQIEVAKRELKERG